MKGEVRERGKVRWWKDGRSGEKAALSLSFKSTGYGKEGLG